LSGLTYGWYQQTNSILNNNITYNVTLSGLTYGWYQNNNLNSQNNYNYAYSLSGYVNSFKTSFTTENLYIHNNLLTNNNNNLLIYTSISNNISLRCGNNEIKNISNNNSYSTVNETFYSGITIYNGIYLPTYSNLVSVSDLNNTRGTGSNIQSQITSINNNISNLSSYAQQTESNSTSNSLATGILGIGTALMGVGAATAAISLQGQIIGLQGEIAGLKGLIDILNITVDTLIARIDSLESKTKYLNGDTIHSGLNVRGDSVLGIDDRRFNTYVLGKSIFYDNVEIRGNMNITGTIKDTIFGQVVQWRTL
jgi:hypothetical protein